MHYHMSCWYQRMETICMEGTDHISDHFNRLWRTGALGDFCTVPQAHTCSNQIIPFRSYYLCSHFDLLPKTPEPFSSSGHNANSWRQIISLSHLWKDRLPRGLHLSLLRCGTSLTGNHIGRPQNPVVCFSCYDPFIDFSGTDSTPILQYHLLRSLWYSPPVL